MQKALTILALLEPNLPEIKQALGEQWPALAGQIQAQVTLFAALSRALAVADQSDLPELSEALDNTANHLLGYFVADETACQILTRPEVQSPAASIEILSKRYYLLPPSDSPDSEPEPPETIEMVAAVANRFILLCQGSEEAAKPDPPLSDQPDSDPENYNPHSND